MISPHSRGGVVSCFRTVRDRSRARTPMDGFTVCSETRHYTASAPCRISSQYPSVTQVLHSRERCLSALHPGFDDFENVDGVLILDEGTVEFIPVDGLQFFQIEIVRVMHFCD